MKLAINGAPSLSLRDLALGDRFSQAWKPNAIPPAHRKAMSPARSPVLRDEDELHVASFAKKAAAFFRISRSAFSLTTSRRRRSISSCSGFIWPWPGKACRVGAVLLHPLAQHVLVDVQVAAGLRRRSPRSRPACTASILNSRLNFRLCIHLRFHETPKLGVHQTGSS